MTAAGAGDAEQHSPTTSDERMADILAGGSGRQRMREKLREEGSEDADDVLRRLNALDFVDSLVGEASDVPERMGDYRITGLLGRGGGDVPAVIRRQCPRSMSRRLWT